jgi:hypothetical protein
MTRVAEVSHADELPQLNQLRCRRTDARKFLGDPTHDEFGTGTR